MEFLPHLVCTAIHFDGIIAPFYCTGLLEGKHMIRKDCDYIAGSFDRCLDCKYLGVGCDGPRTSTMSNDRWLWWIKALKQKRGYTNDAIVEGTGLSKGTINNIFSGANKDVKRTTAGILEDFLIGSDGKWPCPIDSNTDREVIYEDKPETLAMLNERNIQVENLRRNNDELRASVDRELERIRAEYKEDIEEYKALVAHMRTQVNRKDDYIDRLAKKAGI